MTTKNVSIEATAVAGTSSAICVTLGKPGVGRTEYWIPQSQIHDNSEVYKAGDTGKLIMSRWIAKKKDIEDRCEDYDDDD